MLEPGKAIRIFTGAAMPQGADTVFMQEDVTVEGDHVRVPKGLKRGANRRLAGEDVPSGAVVLPAGTVLEAQHVALAAALGITEIAVRRRLNVAILSTGDEVVEPGAVRGSTAIYDANRYLLAELLERLGTVVTDLGILGDDPEKLSRALRAAATGHDLIADVGGVSRGEEDCARDAVERVGKLGILARRHQAGQTGGVGRDLFIGASSRLRRPAGQSGRGICHLRARCETATAPAVGCAARPNCTVARACSLRVARKRKIGANMSALRSSGLPTAKLMRSNTHRMVQEF